MLYPEQQSRPGLNKPAQDADPASASFPQSLKEVTGFAAGGWDYPLIKELIQGERKPCMLVDMDILDANIKALCGVAEAHGKHIRLGTKSVRVPELIEYIVKNSGERICGLMCYSAPEAEFLSERFHKNNLPGDFFIAYPTVFPADLACLWRMMQGGSDVTVTVDSPAHVRLLADYWRREAGGSSEPLRVALGIDVSWRVLGQHIGVRHSGLRGLTECRELVSLINNTPELELKGAMTYEAQIAGVTDSLPGHPVRNGMMKVMKYLSGNDVSARRQEFRQWLDSEGIRLEFHNGGGTGSVVSTCQDPAVDEVAVGSGFLQPGLFDFYEDNRRSPAACFALQVTRRPDAEHVVCQSGGFIGSGAVEPVKAPSPFLPAGLKLLPHEGAGEVQTPLWVPKELRDIIQIGDPVLFRPAKAGEIAEQFNGYMLKRGEKIEGTVPTYRGLGHVFR